MPQSHDHTTQQQQWAAVHTRIPHAPSVAMRVFRPLTAPPIRQLCFSVFRFSTSVYIYTTVIIYYIHKLELSAGPVRVFRCRVLGTVGKYENTSRGHRTHGSWFRASFFSPPKTRSNTALWFFQKVFFFFSCTLFKARSYICRRKRRFAVLSRRCRALTGFKQREKVDFDFNPIDDAFVINSLFELLNWIVALFFF